MLVATIYSTGSDSLTFTEQLHTYKQQNPDADCVINYALKDYYDADVYASADAPNAPSYFNLDETNKIITL